jgi:hypothetical protein
MMNSDNSAALSPAERWRFASIIPAQDLSNPEAVHRLRDSSMNSSISSVLACLAAGTIASAIGPNTNRRLTPQRIAELTEPSTKAQARAISIEIADLQNPAPESGHARPGVNTTNSRIKLPMDGREGIIEVIREFRFPTQFDPPKVDLAEKMPLVAPLTPHAFETVNTGWTIRLNAHPIGNLIALYGVADYVEFRGFDEAGYGPFPDPFTTSKTVSFHPTLFNNQCSRRRRPAFTYSQCPERPTMSFYTTAERARNIASRLPLNSASGVDSPRADQVRSCKSGRRASLP